MKTAFTPLAKCVHVPLEKAEDIDLVDTAKRCEIDKPFDVMRAQIGGELILIDKISASAEGFVHERKRQDQVQIKGKKQVKQTAQERSVACSQKTKPSTAVKDQTDEREHEGAQNRVDRILRCRAVEHLDDGKANQ